MKFVYFSRQAGHRFGEQLWRVAPSVLEYSKDTDEELREHCLQALEAFVLKCPKEVQPHIPTVNRHNWIFLFSLHI